MSQETVQFVEMIRQAASQIQPRPYHKFAYCEHCNCQRPHAVTQAGRGEIYTCRICGYQKLYS